MSSQKKDIEIVLEQPGVPVQAPGPSDEPIFRPRRAHTKSRVGCLNCRRRRIKCDEKQDQCTQCSDRGLRCEYRSPAVTAFNVTRVETAESALVPTQADEANSLRTRIRRVLTEANFPRSHFSSTVYTAAHAFELYEHFVERTDQPWMGSPLLQSILQSCADAALEAPWVLHALLAFSAAHLSYLYPEEKRYVIASTQHYSHALTLYNQHLSAVPAVPDLDLRLEAVFLHAMLAFLNAPTTSANQAWAEGGDPSWIPSFIGINSILGSPCFSTYSYDERTWDPLLEKYQDRPPAPASCAPVGNPTPAQKALAEVAMLWGNAGPVEAPNAYAVEISRLHILVGTAPDDAAIDNCVSLVANFSPGFKELPKRNDPRALLLLGTWCAVFGSIEQWWIIRSAKLECHRICAYLFKLDDETLEKPLRFLCDWCGYGDIELDMAGIRLD